MKCFPHSIICGILDVGGVLSGKECPNGRDEFIYVMTCLCFDVRALGLSIIGPGVVEIWVEVFPPQYILRNFECLGLVEWEGVPQRS